MNLALDASYSLGDELSGIGIYSRELLHGLAREHPSQQFRWLYRPHQFRRALYGEKPVNVRREVLFDLLGPRGDLFHGLNQRLPKRRYRKQVATFHDLFVLSGEYSTAEFRQRFAEQARHAAAEADRIIAVSQFTADQVHSLLGVERSRIRVIHHGIVRRKLPDLPREKFVLSVGAIQERKNTRRLIQAFRRMPGDWRLVLAGAAGFGAESIVSEIRDSRVTITGYVPDSDLSRLYATASIFAFPSLDEGFGMPVLEAMAAGIPVITSNRSAMPEVAGGAAVLVDPTIVGELADALCLLSEHAQERAGWAEKGRLRAQYFTWSRAVAGTYKVYEELTSRLPRQS